MIIENCILKIQFGFLFWKKGSSTLYFTVIHRLSFNLVLLLGESTYQ